MLIQHHPAPKKERPLVLYQKYKKFFDDVKDIYKLGRCGLQFRIQPSPHSDCLIFILIGV